MQTEYCEFLQYINGSFKKFNFTSARKSRRGIVAKLETNVMSYFYINSPISYYLDTPSKNDSISNYS